MEPKGPIHLKPNGFDTTVQEADLQAQENREEIEGLKD